VQAEAYTAAEANRGRKILTGKVTDTDGCIYGLHYGYGDLLGAEYKRNYFDAHLDVLHVVVQDGRETVDNQIRAEVPTPTTIGREYGLD
jgi:hypothetical protein